jgi:ATP-dependent DNA helicase RecG
MLNEAGGSVLYGVDDQGHVVGVTIGSGTIEEVDSELRQISPAAHPTIEVVELDGRVVIVVSTHRGTLRPYTHRGQPYERHHSSTVQMPQQRFEQLMLERLHGAQRWEMEPAEGMTVADLDLDEIKRTLEESIQRGRQADPGTREPGAILRGFGLIPEGRLTRAAAVLFGRPEQLQERLPQCRVRLARFKGIDQTEFLDNRQVTGNVFRLLDAADRFLRDHVPVAGLIRPDRLERQDVPLYPPLATREALANAFCHREYEQAGGSVGVAIYDDRLEISSPGVLHFGLRPKDLFEPHESLPWNPAIARILFQRGIIESWGSGTLRIAEAVEEAGLPRAEIVEIAGGLVVRLRQSRYVPPSHVRHDLTPRQQAILDLLGSGTLLRSEIIQQLPPPTSSRSAVNRDLVFLRQLGLVRLTGVGRGARWGLAGPA